MGTSVRILVDNQTGKGLAEEHGFSLWVETDGQRILFDTGQGRALAANALALGVDLGSAGAVVVSHGHYDHAGGLATLPLAEGRMQAYLHPAAVQPHYVIREGLSHDIGMPGPCRSCLGRVPDECLHWVGDPLWLSPQACVTGPIPRRNDFEDPGGPFYLDPRGARPDLIEDDQALFLKTGKGLVVLLGCCHAGLVNTLERIHELSGGAPIRAIIGGFHLLCAAKERMKKTIAALAAEEPELIAACHCTGANAMDALKSAFPERVVIGRSGMLFEFS